MIGNAAVMGWTPQQLGASTLSEYRAALAGWNRAKGETMPASRDDVKRARAAMARANQREERRRRA